MNAFHQLRAAAPETSIVKTIGIIKPSTRPGRAEELMVMLPPDIDLYQTNLEISNGTRAEVEQGLIDIEAKVADMAAHKVDLIHPAGVPPLLLGYEGEQALVRRWEKQYGIPVFTNGQSQIDALRAFGAKRVVAASYFRGDINKEFAAYIESAGFEVLGIQGMDVDFQAVPQLEASVIHDFIKAQFDPHRGKADAVYLVGPAWRRSLDIVEEMEQEFGVPVIHHVPCQSWAIQRILKLHFPVQGYGRLIRELPGLQ